MISGEIELNWVAKVHFCPIVPNGPFFHPLKTPEKFTVFWCFQGVENAYFALQKEKNIWSASFQAKK